MASLSLLQANLPGPGIEPGSLALQADSLPAELSGKPEEKEAIAIIQKVTFFFPAPSLGL